MQKVRRRPPDVRKPSATGEMAVAATGASRLKLVPLLAIVSAIVVTTMWPCLSANVISFDDEQYVTNNVLVRNPSWSSTARFFSEVLHPSTIGGYYQPLTMVSLMLDCARGGGPDNLRPFHETSLALHVANVCLLVVLLYVLFGNMYVAAAIGLIYGVHPQMVEPVTWIGDRKTPLASLFALVSLIAYVSWTRDPREGQRPRFSAAMFVCVGAYVVSLLAKPTTIMLPIAFALLDFWPLRRLSVRSVLEKAPLFAVMFVSAVVTYVSQKNTSAVILPRHGEDVPMLLGLCYRVVFYLHKFLLPVRLTSLYPIPKPLSLANGQILASLLAAVALAAATLLSLRRTRAFAVGGLIFFVLLAPTLGTIQFTHMIVADKYMYFPVIGLLITLTWLVVQATSRVAFAKKASIPLLIGIVALEAAGTRGYLAIWRDGERFDKHKAAMAPDSALAQYDMGVTFVNLHRPAEAIASYRRALELDPNNASAHNNLGNVLAGEGQLDEALGHLTRAVQLDPAVPDARMNLANLLAMKGQYDQAFAHYESLLQNPRAKDCGNRRNYAFALFKAGLFDRAIVQFNKVIELGCGNARVHCRLGAAFAAIGRRDEALQHLQKAVQLDPQWPEPAELAARLTASAPGNP